MARLISGLPRRAQGCPNRHTSRLRDVPKGLGVAYPGLATPSQVDAGNVAVSRGTVAAVEQNTPVSYTHLTLPTTPYV